MLEEVNLTPIKNVLLPAIANRFDSSVLLEVTNNFYKASFDKYGNATVLKDFELNPTSMGNLSSFFKRVTLTITYGYSENLLKLDENGEPVIVDNVVVRTPGVVVEYYVRYEVTEGGFNGISYKDRLYL